MPNVNRMVTDPLGARARAKLAALAHHYREVFGWQIEDDTEQGVVSVVLSGPCAAFSVPEQDIRRICRIVDQWGEPSPALRLPGVRPLWIVLADARDQVFDSDLLPPNVRALPVGSTLPLPPSITEHGPVRWVCEPDHSRRWMPSAATVLYAARAVPGMPVRRTTSTRKVEPRDQVVMRRRPI